MGGPLVKDKIEIILAELATCEARNAEQKEVILAEIDRPHCGSENWHSYVPPEIRNLWLDLSKQAKLMAALMAMDHASSSWSD